MSSNTWDGELVRKGYEIRTEFVGESSREYERSYGPQCRRSAWKDGKQVASVVGFPYATQGQLVKAVAKIEGTEEVKAATDFGLVTEEDDDTITYRHPSFGRIWCGRYQGGQRFFFGSKVGMHHGGMKLVIEQGREVYRRDKYQGGILDGTAPSYSYTGRTLIEVCMSMTQWGELIAAVNGAGTPCTIRHHPEHGHIELPDVTGTHMDVVREASQQAMKRATAELRKVVDELVPELKKPGALKASEKHELAERIEKVARLLTDRLPFLASEFDEALEDALAVARAELGQYANELKLPEGTPSMLPESTQ